jgi:heat shock protein HtpX
MFKRITLFLATNFAVLVLFSIVMAVFGIDPATMGGLLVLCAVMGFGGAFI